MFIFGYISILLPPTVLAQTTTSPTPAATIPAALLQIFDGVTVPPVQVTAELSAYSKHLTLLEAYGAFTQDVAHFITDSWPTNVPAALSSLYSSWTANDGHVPNFYTEAVSFFESITKVNAALSAGLIGTSQLSFIASYSYDAALLSSDYFTPTALRVAIVTPTGDGGIAEVGVLSVTSVPTNVISLAPTDSDTPDGSASFFTSAPGNPTALPSLPSADPKGLDFDAGQPLQPITPISTGSFPGFDSFTTGQVQTAGGEGDVSAVPSIGGPLTGTGFTNIDGPSNFPIIQSGTAIGSGQVQTQGSGVFLIETGAGFTIFDAPELTAPVTLLDKTKTQNLVTKIVTVTVDALPSMSTSPTSSGTLTTVSTALAASTTFVPESSSAAAAGGWGRGLGLGHVKVLERLGAAVVGYAVLMVGFWLD